jgi:hypothetical protein
MGRFSGSGLSSRCGLFRLLSGKAAGHICGDGMVAEPQLGEINGGTHIGAGREVSWREAFQSHENIGQRRGPSAAKAISRMAVQAEQSAERGGLTNQA